MKAAHRKTLWIILPLLALAGVLAVKLCAPSEPTEDTATPSVVAEEETPPSLPQPSTSPTPAVVQVCPDDTFPVVIVGSTAYLTDYSGQLPLSLPSDTIVEITCGSSEGTYEIHTYDLMTYDEPDVILESCSDMFCTGAYSLVMLERV